MSRHVLANREPATAREVGLSLLFELWWTVGRSAGAEPMDAPKITFEDGTAYERMMGTWSRIAGKHFVDWLQPRRGMHWIDVGCGNGAFTELLIDRCAAAKVDGIDPSQAQIDYARSRREGSDAVSFHRGDALSLPFQDDSVDAAAMALVIFFLPDPPRVWPRCLAWFGREVLSLHMHGTLPEVGYPGDR
jgi:SAM-dependent methyltransferase